MAGDIQPAPWRLRGEALVAFKLVRKELAQTLVPPDARIICVWPGRTLAILYLAQYRDSPVGEYREIIVAPAMIQLQGRVGAWISHILVDSERSVIAGRSIWALPKERASMQWQPARFRVDAPPLDLQAVFAPPRFSMRVPLAGAALSMRDGVANRFFVHGTARVGVTRATIDVPNGADLKKLGLQGALRAYVCRDMDITIGPPRAG